MLTFITMIILSKQDLYSSHINGLVADYDLETLTTLYQPILGHQPIILYLSLLSQAKIQRVYPTSNHEELLFTLRFTIEDFVESRKRLEAVGLLKTYRKKNKDHSSYTYILNAPKTPKNFFEDALLFGLLIKFIGEEKAFKIKAYFRSDIVSDLGDDISASFGDVFDLCGPAFKKAVNTLDGSLLLDREGSKVKLEFDFDIFKKELSKISQINAESLGKKTLNEIARLSTLYGVDEKHAAYEVSELYDRSALSNKRIDFKKLGDRYKEITKTSYIRKVKDDASEGLVSSDSLLAKKINLMETVSPRDYLSFLQNGTNPTSADLRLIEDIARDTGLTNAVINVLIEFVLLKNNNILNRAYMERMASSLAREGLLTAREAMDFLNKITKSRKRRTTTKAVSEDTKKPEIIKKPEEKEDSDDEWDEMFNDKFN